MLELATGDGISGDARRASGGTEGTGDGQGDEGECDGNK